MEKISDLISRRKQKIADFKKLNLNPFPNDFVVSHTIAQIKNIVEDPTMPVTEEAPRQVAVLNSLNGNHELPFIAITISDLPRLIQVSQSEIEYVEADSKEDEPEEILARMNFSG